MANSEQLEKETELQKLEEVIAAYLDFTEDVNGHSIKRRDLAYNNIKEYNRILGDLAVYLVDY